MLVHQRVVAPEWGLQESKNPWAGQRRYDELAVAVINRMYARHVFWNVFAWFSHEHCPIVPSHLVDSELPSGNLT